MFSVATIIQNEQTIFIRQKLDSLLAKGKNILQLTTICSKYETERELVQPFKAQNMTEHPKAAITSNNGTLKDFKEVRSFDEFSSFLNEKKIYSHF